MTAVPGENRVVSVPGGVMASKRGKDASAKGGGGASSGKASAKKSSAKKTAAKKTAVGKTSAKKAPAKKASKKKTAAGKDGKVEVLGKGDDTRKAEARATGGTDERASEQGTLDDAAADAAPAAASDAGRGNAFQPPIADPKDVAKLAARLQEMARADSQALLQAIEDLEMGVLEGAATAVEAVDLIRHMGRYDYLLSEAGVKLPPPENLEARFLTRLLVHRAVQAGGDLENAGLFGRRDKKTMKALTEISSGRDWTEEYPDRAKNTVSYLAARYSMPHWLAAELLAQHGLMKAEAIGQGSLKEPRQALAVNLGRTKLDELQRKLREEGISTDPGRYSEHTLVVPADADLRSTKAYEAGLFEIVEEVEQIVCHLASAGGPASVLLLKGARGSMLDACLACRLAGKDKLTVLAPDPGETLAVKRRAMRLGSLMVRVMEAKPGEPLDSERIGRADVVVVEAESSETGSIYRDPLAPWRLRPEVMDDLVKVQLAALEGASAMVAPRGRLVYVTRSVLFKENQEVVASFLEGNPRFVRVPIRHLGNNLGEFETQEDFLQVLPGQGEMSGAFTAVMELEW